MVKERDGVAKTKDVAVETLRELTVSRDLRESWSSTDHRNEQDFGHLALAGPGPSGEGWCAQAGCHLQHRHQLSLCLVITPTRCDTPVQGRPWFSVATRGYMN